MEDYGYEMPTPCQNCGNIFELNDGYGSEKWFPHTVICKNCYEEEQREIELDEEIETAVEQFENAMYELKDSIKYLKGKGAFDKLSDEGKSLVRHIMDLGIVGNGIEKIILNAEFLFKLDSKRQWIDRVPHILPDKKVAAEKWVWVDSEGYTFEMGEDFMVAETVKSYPVKVYRLIRRAENKQQKQ